MDRKVPSDCSHGKCQSWISMRNTGVRGKGVKCLFGMSYGSLCEIWIWIIKLWVNVREVERDFYLKHISDKAVPYCTQIIKLPMYLELCAGGKPIDFTAFPFGFWKGQKLCSLQRKHQSWQLCITYFCSNCSEWSRLWPLSKNCPFIMMQSEVRLIVTRGWFV